jgi:hypothetical protein
MWMYQKRKVHVGILRGNGTVGEIIVQVNNEDRDNISNMDELKSLSS